MSDLDIKNGFVTDKPLVFVLGMHRSGTSMLTRILNLLGLETSNNLISAGAHNAMGYWESAGVIALNDRILRAMHSAWYDPQPVVVSELPSSDWDAFTAEARQLIERELTGACGAVLKDPRFCRTAPIWFEAAHQSGFTPKALCTVRHPAEVMGSIIRRNQLTPDHAGQLWQSYMIEAELNSRNVPRVCISDEGLLADWKTELVPALSDLSVSVTEPDDALVSVINGFVRPSERHHDQTEPAINLHEVEPNGLDRTYSAFLNDRTMADRITFDQMVKERASFWERRMSADGRQDFTQSLPQGFMEKSEEHVLLDEPKRALYWLAKGIQRFPDHPGLYIRTANLLMSQKRSREAILFLERLIEIAPDVPGHYGALARAHLDERNPDKAKGAIDTALSLAPDSAIFLNLAGRVHMQLKDPETAETYFSKCIVADNQNAAGYAGAAEALLALGQHERALKHAKKARKLDPERRPYRKILNRVRKAINLGNATSDHPIPLPGDGEN